jgi:type IV pilus assembly protein PilC
MRAMSSRRLFDLYSRLADLLASGASLRRALEMLRTGSSAPLRRVADEALAAIDRGGRVSEGLEAGGVPALDAAVLRLGEETGSLDDACRRLAEHHEWRLKVRSLWLAGLASPALALAILAVALIGVAYALHGPSAAATRFVLMAAALTALAAGAMLLRLTVSAVPGLSAAVHRMALSLPLFGGILLNLARARFFLFLSQLQGSGASPADALRLAARASGNEYLSGRLAGRAETLVGSGRLTDALRGESIVDRESLETLVVAEEAGTMDAALERLARRYRDDGERTMERRLPLLARMLLIPLVVILFFWGMLDVAITLMQRFFQIIDGQIDKVRLPGV